MSFSYKPLWKLLIDYDMSKKDLMKATDISKSTMDKMGRGETSVNGNHRSTLQLF